MSITKNSVQLTFLTVVAIVSVIAGLSLVKLPEALIPDERIEVISGRVGLSQIPQGESDGLMRVELMLLDPTPLFLPTDLNSGKVDEAMTAERSPGASFESIGAKYVFTEADLKLALPQVVKTPRPPFSDQGT